jgi:hypothetical protein
MMERVRLCHLPVAPSLSKAHLQPYNGQGKLLVNEAERYHQGAQRCYQRAQRISYRSAAQLLKHLGDECMAKAQELERAQACGGDSTVDNSAGIAGG